MRYDQTAVYYDEDKHLTECIHQVNVTDVGMDKQVQLLGAGDLSENYVTIRMREQTRYAAGYFKIDSQVYRIAKSQNTQKGTSYLGVESDVRLRD